MAAGGARRDAGGVAGTPYGTPQRGRGRDLGGRRGRIVRSGVRVDPRRRRTPGPHDVGGAGLPRHRHRLLAHPAAEEHAEPVGLAGLRGDLRRVRLAARTAPAQRAGPARRIRLGRRPAEGRSPHHGGGDVRGGGADDPANNAQNPSSYLGKMIRINVDAPPYTPEIWAMGLRNPFRWSFDRTTGDMWIGDVGQGQKEEINFRPLGTRGANYGWPCIEGTLDNSSAPDDADCSATQSVDVMPVLDYDIPGAGRSVIGGYVYRGNEYADLKGYYMATDFFSGRVWLVRPNGGGWDIIERTGFPTGIASISEASNGALYAVSYTGNMVYKIVTPIAVPLTLLNFSGTPLPGYNELKWITESEQNMDKYVVEYSDDGYNYSSVGEVVSENDVNRRNYSFRHTVTSSSPVAYYRLKMLEINGTHQFSAVIRIGNQVSAGVRIYPTSVSNNLLNIVSDKPVEKIKITNTNGAELFAKDINGTSGFFTITLPVLQKGIYIVRVTGKSFQHTEKIVVQ